jgi:hypothetical protein
MTIQTDELVESIGSLVSSYYWQLAVVLTILIVLFVLLRRRQPSSVPAFETEAGSVSVARSAIVELVRTACEQIRGVRNPRICLKLHKNSLDVVVRIKLASDCRLETFSKTLQTHLKRSLQDNLGINNLRQVNLIVTGFRSAELKTENFSSVKNKATDSQFESASSSLIDSSGNAVSAPFAQEEETNPNKT